MSPWCRSGAVVTSLWCMYFRRCTFTDWKQAPFQNNIAERDCSVSQDLVEPWGIFAIFVVNNQKCNPRGVLPLMKPLQQITICKSLPQERKDFHRKAERAHFEWLRQKAAIWRAWATLPSHAWLKCWIELLADHKSPWVLAWLVEIGRKSCIPRLLHLHPGETRAMLKKSRSLFGAQGAQKIPGWRHWTILLIP